MLRYAVAKLLLAIPLLLGVSLIIFLLGLSAPGDPVLIMVGEAAPDEEVVRLRSQLGLDQPWYLQYAQFVGRAVQGDLGVSYRSRLPVAEEVLVRFPATLELTGAAMLFAIPLGVTLGALAARHRGGQVDRLAILLSTVGVAMPIFWSGLLLILLFSLTLGWLPASGRGGPQHLILPGLALGLGAAALIARLTRTGVLEVMEHDFVRTARSKGLPERVVLLRHIARNALVPVLAAIGLQVGGLLAGAVLAETVFGWPGLGRLTVQAIEQRDFPVIRGAVLLVAATITVVNLVLDFLYAYLDPRIRYS